MRRYLLFCAFSMLALLSCTKEHPFDVEEVRFPKEGGVQVIHSQGYGHEVISADGSGKTMGFAVDYRPGHDQVISIGTYEWLTIECISYTEIKLTAEKNETGKERKLTLRAMVGDHGGTIPVIQE